MRQGVGGQTRRIGEDVVGGVGLRRSKRRHCEEFAVEGAAIVEETTKGTSKGLFGRLELERRVVACCGNLLR